MPDRCQELFYTYRVSTCAAFTCICTNISPTLIQASRAVVKTSLSTSPNEFASLLGGILKMSILPSGRGAGVAAICE